MKKILLDRKKLCIKIIKFILMKIMKKMINSDLCYFNFSNWISEMRNCHRLIYSNCFPHVDCFSHISVYFLSFVELIKINMYKNKISSGNKTDMLSWMKFRGLSVCFQIKIHSKISMHFYIRIVCCFYSTILINVFTL